MFSAVNLKFMLTIPNKLVAIAVKVKQLPRFS